MVACPHAGRVHAATEDCSIYLIRPQRSNPRPILGHRCIIVSGRRAHVSRTKEGSELEEFKTQPVRWTQREKTAFSETGVSINAFEYFIVSHLSRHTIWRVVQRVSGARTMRQHISNIVDNEKQNEKQHSRRFTRANIQRLLSHSQYHYNMCAYKGC